MTSARRVDVVTLGCRLNIVESQEMRRLANATSQDEGRDTIVVNTCAVTTEAARRSGQAVRRALRGDANARVIVTGCASEVSPEDFAGLSDRVKVLPNAAKTDAAPWRSLLAPIQASKRSQKEGDVPDAPIPLLSPGGKADVSTSPPPAAGGNHTRGFVAVQNGCDHRCTFCIIPFGRGASRSLPSDQAIAKIRTLVEDGRADVTLTGVDLTSWGVDVGDGQRLGDLVKNILRDVPALKRLRLSSLDCIEADEALLDAFATEERLMPHLHLSLQSGDDLILKRMKRRHARADAVRFCERLRVLRPGIVFGADLIAGFPTETEAMFANTLALSDDCGLTHLHVFPYSARPGTPAARMPPVSASVVSGRAARLREVGERRLARHLDGLIGQTAEVLVERGAIGRVPDFSSVRVPPALSPGTFVNVRLVGHDGCQLLGAEAVGSPSN